MKPSDSTIYAVCIQGETVRYKAQSQIIPLMGGSCHLEDSERQRLRLQGYVFDDENARYSAFNSHWGELSCVHWMLQNAGQSNIGNAQYRRNWIEPTGGWYEEDTLYVPEFGVFNCSIEQQFYGGHSAFDAPAITRTLADSGQWAFTREEIDKLWAQNLFIGCNMARGPKEHYQQFMGTFLDCLMPIWESHKEHFLSIQGYDKRALAFTGERLFTGLVLYRDKFFPNMKIETAPIGFIP
jgi:hypothetical protein